mmetsp:Transcript_17405/g.32553  ORF Transcript_17405/g.32553 Transcript_17405/m.32553 type:complete len:151 (+) Transcript_17405:1-453(+)
MHMFITVYIRGGKFGLLGGWFENADWIRSEQQHYLSQINCSLFGDTIISSLWFCSLPVEDLGRFVTHPVVPCSFFLISLTSLACLACASCRCRSSQTTCKGQTGIHQQHAKIEHDKVNRAAPMTTVNKTLSFSQQSVYSPQHTLASSTKL